MKKNQRMGSGERTMLAIMAGQAFDVQHASDLTGELTKDEWRLQECMAVTGRRLSEGLAEDVELLKAHFVQLGARVPPSKTKRPWLTGDARTRSQMLWRLDQSLKVCEKSRAYALEVARPMLKDYAITFETMALDDLRKLLMEFSTRAKSAMKAGTVGGQCGETFLKL